MISADIGVTSVESGPPCELFFPVRLLYFWRTSGPLVVWTRLLQLGVPVSYSLQPTACSLQSTGDRRCIYFSLSVLHIESRRDMRSLLQVGSWPLAADPLP